MLFGGKVHLPCWRFIVVRHDGNVHWDVYCILFLRWVAADIYPFLLEHLFQGLASWNSIYVQSTL